MIAITLNPGFVLIAAALAVLAAPGGWRAPIMAGACLLGLWMMLSPEFGAYDAFAQIGMVVVPFALDELNSAFGVAFLGAAVFLSIDLGARRDRYECAAVMLLGGATVAALFAGDFISFIAGASLAGLAAAWVVFASGAPGSGAAGVRLLVWHGLEGLLFLVGVAIHMSSSDGGAPLSRMSPGTLGGAFIFAALMIRVGAPLAHVWLKDAVAHASGAGAGALSAFTAMLGVYALLRVFAGEVLLAPIGMAMMLVGTAFACAKSDLRQAGAYALTAQTGVCVAMIGLGAPLALAASVSHAFVCVFGFLLLHLGLGALASAYGAANLATLAGAARRMPLTAAFTVAGGWAAAGAPGLSGYVSLSIALDAASQWESRYLWLAILACTAGLWAVLAVRPAAVLLAKTGEARGAGGGASFAALLAMALAAFLCAAVGLAPEWLYGLTPVTGLAFAPYAPDRLGPALQLFGAGGVVFLAAHALGLSPADAHMRVRDMDALYRGPLSRAERAAGTFVLGLLARAGAGTGAGLAWLSRWAGALARLSDQPYARDWRAAAGAAVIWLLFAFVLWARAGGT